MEEEFFLCTLDKAQRKSVFIFPFILSCFSFVSNATSFFIHVLNRFVLKKAAYTLLVFFSQVAFLLLVYVGKRRKPFLYRVNIFQIQNTDEHNFNLIMKFVCLIVT